MKTKTYLLYTWLIAWLIPLTSLSIGAQVSTNVPNLLCENEPFQIAVTEFEPGTNYLWTDIDGQILGVDSFSLSIDMNTSIILNTSGAINQADTFNIGVVIPPAPQVEWEDLACDGTPGSAAVINPDPNWQYVWRNSIGATISIGPTVDDLPTGSYSVEVIETTSGIGCNSVVGVAIQLIEFPDIDLANLADNPCAEDQVGAISVSVDDGSPPYQYFWTDAAGNSIPGTTIIDNLPNGEYTLLVVDVVECEDEVTFTVSSDPLPEITLETQPAICDQPNGAINLSAFPGISTIQLNGITTSLNDLQSIPPGDYQALVENQNGCTITDTLINVANTTPFDFSGDSTLFVEAGELTLFTIPGVNDQDFSFEWLPRTNLTCYDCPDPRVETNEDLVYQVIVEDINSGCNGQFQLFVEVLPPQDLYIPNVFSPNFDGINDQFQAFPSDVDLEILQIAVFDRWGTMLFQGNGEDAAWDGTFRGLAAGTGTYSYFVEIQYRTGRREVLTGDLLLLR